MGERGTDDGDCGGKGGWLISLARQHIQSFTKMYVLGCEKLLLSKTGLLVHICTESLDKTFPVVLFSASCLSRAAEHYACNSRTLEKRFWGTLYSTQLKGGD